MVLGATSASEEFRQHLKCGAGFASVEVTGEGNILLSAPRYALPLPPPASALLSGFVAVIYANIELVARNFQHAARTH